jgi:SNF2 family DNA or RNA helicase
MTEPRAAPTGSTAALPEQGQVVFLRHKVWTVKGITRVGPAVHFVHRVSLECLSDDELGRVLDVIWEREVAPSVLAVSSLPIARGLDSLSRFQTFLDAVRWSSASLAEGNTVQAPFRGGVEIEEYQLVPVTRAVSMPRVTLLIADDVGLGKTIEAGLIAQELIHTHRASRILVLCPAHLKAKWVEEMRDKFGLEFRIIDRDSVLKMRREFGPTVNPWASFPRLVTSIDYLKTEQPRRLFEELFDKRSREKGTKPWDLLILDEAHNVAPAGRKHYVRDSDRTTLLRAITSHFEHKLFLTATPHNGHRESFTGLLELLDDLRFSRGLELDPEQLAAVRIRRLKGELRRPDGRLRFPPRVVLPKSLELHPDLYVDLTHEEQEVFTLLQQYTQSRLQDLEKRFERPTQFVLTLLKKRALSSPLALRESLVTHTRTVGVQEELGVGDSLFRSLAAREEDEWSDDEEKEEHIEATNEAASRLCKPLSEQEKVCLQRMFETADRLHQQPDSKARALLRWIDRQLRAGDAWNGERVIIFTEYRHTLEYLKQLLEASGFGDAVKTIYGGMPDDERSAANDAFQSPPEQTAVRILLATDAASEGADFQRYCRNLIHYEIPWNPVRLEQRNGRIDRHGQTADEVRVHHFVFRNNEDSEFLTRIIEKVETIRADLGSVGSLIAESARQHALGRKVDIESIEKNARRELARQDLQLGRQAADDASAMVLALNEARAKLDITNERQEDVLREALALEGKPHALQVVGNGQLQLTEVPPAWSECRRFVSTPTREVRLTFARTHGTVDAGTVLHLDHPLMRRAIATLRAQMWRSIQHDGHEGSLFRVCAADSSHVRHPTLLAWVRLLLVGPERNSLHDGLLVAGAELHGGILTEINTDPLLSGLSASLSVSTVTPGDIEQLVAPVRERLETLARQKAEKRAEELSHVLAARGATAEKQTRGLSTERMNEILRTIRQWEKEAASAQLPLFEDEEERSQREHDLESLRARMVELEAARETEPRRQRLLFKVVEWRAHPMALQVLLPKGGN